MVPLSGEVAVDLFGRALSGWAAAGLSWRTCNSPAHSSSASATFSSLHRTHDQDSDLPPTAIAVPAGRRGFASASSLHPSPREGVIVVADHPLVA